MGADVGVEVLRESELDDWVRLVGSSPDGTVYALPRYLEALCAAAGGRFTVLGVRHGAELAGGVALYERDSRFGRYVAPRLLLYFNGPVLRRYDTKYPSEQTARHLKVLTALEQAVRARGYGRVTFTCNPSFADARPFLAAGWSAALQYTYVVDISAPTVQWPRVEQNLRRLVQRCEREGMNLVADDDFDTFRELHSRTMARKHESVYIPGNGFRRYFETLHTAGLCRLFHARLPSGQVVASQLVLLGPGGWCCVVAAAADEAYLRSGVSAFLRWKAFETLSAAGYVAVDLTDASLNAVTHFKSQFGGELKPLLVLDAPRSLCYRLGGGARAAAHRAKRAVSRIAPVVGLRHGAAR